MSRRRFQAAPPKSCFREQAERRGRLGWHRDAIPAIGGASPQESVRAQGISLCSGAPLRGGFCVFRNAANDGGMNEVKMGEAAGATTDSCY